MPDLEKIANALDTDALVSDLKFVNAGAVPQGGPGQQGGARASGNAKVQYSLEISLKLAPVIISR